MVKAFMEQQAGMVKMCVDLCMESGERFCTECQYILMDYSYWGGVRVGTFALALGSILLIALYLIFRKKEN